MRTLMLLLVLSPGLALGQPHPYRRRPPLTDQEIGPPNHLLTPGNKGKFVATGSVPVGANLVVVLPVQSGVAYRWRLELPKDPAELAVFQRALRRIVPPGDGKREDLRALRQDFVTRTGGLVGKVDALQVFKFEATAPASHIPIKFRLVAVVDDAPSNVVFEARVRTVDRAPAGAHRSRP